MFDKKILTLVGAVGGTNLLVTILTAVIATGGVAGPSGATGPVGSSGATGQPGSNGQTPYIGNNGNWWIGSSDTGVSAGGVTTGEEENFIVNQYDLLNNSLTLPALTPLTMDSDWATRVVPSNEFVPVSTRADLEAMVSGGRYILTNDITLTTPWTPLVYQGEQLSIQFDGNGKTIYDLTINGDAVNQAPVGFFGKLYDSVIFNLTFDNASVTKGQLYAQAGVLAGDIDNTWIKNVTIRNSQVNGIKELGVLAGRIFASEVQGVDLINNTITSISAMGALAYSVTDTLVQDVLVNQFNIEPNFVAAHTASVFDAQSDVGGLIGFAGQNVQLDAIRIEETVFDLINGSRVNNYPYVVENIGAVIGRAYGNENYEENLYYFHDIMVTNATILGNTIGGVIGKLEYASTILSDVKVLGSNFYSAYISNDSDVFDLNNLEAMFETRLTSYAGGMIGRIYSSGLLMVDAYVNADIAGNDNIGGFIGEYSGNNYDYEFVYVKNSVSDSNIFLPGSNGGGFAGYLGNISYVVFENSANLSDIDSELLGTFGGSLGGFAGELYEIDNFVLISNSFNAGDIKGSDEVGGFVGYNEVEGLDNDNIPNGGLIIYNSYNHGDVYGQTNVGGFVGEQYNQINILEIHNSLQAGKLYNSDGTTPDFTRDEYGAFIGENENSDSIVRSFNSFYLEQFDDNDNAIPEIASDYSNSLSGGNNNSTLPMTGFITLLTEGSIGEASNLSVTNLDAFTDEDNFYYDGIWNFEEAWTFEYTNNGLPTLKSTYRLPA